MSSLRLLFDFTMLPYEWWLGIAALAIAVFMLMFWKLRGLLVSRIFVASALALLFITPYVSHELWVAQNPVALLVVDQSPSMQFGGRPEQTRAALEVLQNKLRAEENLQVERYDLAATPADSTQLFKELLPVLKNYEAQRLAAVFLITDGQITDVIDAKNWPTDGPPLHVLLVGAPDEQQAYVEITDTPDYAMVGQSANLRLRAHWQAKDSNSDHAILNIQNGDEAWQQKIALGQWINLRLPIRHAGQNRFVIQLPKFDDAVLPATQTATVDVMGVRQSTKILWQSDIANTPPWIEKLKSDPQISFQSAPMTNDKFDADIVILDQPFIGKIPEQRQNALINFIKNGGNILFLQDIPPTENIGAPLQTLLPVTWADKENPKDSLSKIAPSGISHPITANTMNDLTGIPVHTTAMRANDGKTLLQDTLGHSLLAIQNDGYAHIVVANSAIMNENLLRNILQWQISDPAFAENMITASLDDDHVRVEYLAADESIHALSVTRPDRSSFELPLTPIAEGLNTGVFTPDQIGVYRISDGKNETIFSRGNLMMPEYQEIAATSQKLAPLVTATGGQIMWLTQMPQPGVRFVTSRQSGGKDWLALRESRAMISTGSTISPLVPKFALLLIIGSMLAYAWWHESQ